MKKLLLILTPIILMACLSTIPVAQSAPTNPITGDTPVPPTTEIESGAVYELPTETGSQCATITATKAVNLREFPTYHSRVLTWLPTKMQVTVTQRGDWWKVTIPLAGTAGEQSGYVKGLYIELSECEP